MANPKFNADGTVLSVDPISYCYDVTSDQIIATINDFVKYGATSMDAGSSQTTYNLLRSNQLNLARMGLFVVNSGVDSYATQRGYYSSRVSSENDPSLTSIPPVYAVFTCNLAGRSYIASNPMYIYQSNFGDGKTLSSGFTYAPLDLLKKTSNSKAYILAQSYIFNNYTGRYSNGPLKPVELGVRILEATKAIGSQFRDAPMAGSSFFIDTSYSSVPTIYNALIVLADVEMMTGFNSEYLKTIPFIFASKPVSEVMGDYIAVTEPNFFYGKDVPVAKYAMKTPTASYTQDFVTAGPTFAEWFQRITVTLNNGKSFVFPKQSISPSINVGFISPLSMNDNLITYWKNSFTFLFTDTYTYQPTLAALEMNKSKYPFPLQFPRKLVEGDFRIRNGLLYSDASKFYALEFVRFSQNTIDALTTLAILQTSIDEVQKDVASGIIIREGNGQTRTSWYWELGTKMPFIHPVSLKPIAADQYIAELVVESAISWNNALAGINTLTANLKAQNDASYQRAYEAYLRGEAQAKGPEALADYERKLATGFFYTDNGFNYWRPFTPLEISLIQSFKDQAQLSLTISNENILILAKNRLDQDAVNAAVIQANQDKMELARVMANVELKQIADTELSKMIVPTLSYIIARAEIEGGVPTSILEKWTQENPYYYLRQDTSDAVNTLLGYLTSAEQKVTTALVADAIAEIEYTKALQELFTII